MYQLRLVNIANGKADLLSDEVMPDGSAKCKGKLGTIQFSVKQAMLSAVIKKKNSNMNTQSVRVRFTLDENIVHLLINDAIINFGYETYGPSYDAKTYEKSYEDISDLAHSFVSLFETKVSLFETEEECEL